MEEMMKPFEQMVMIGILGAMVFLLPACGSETTSSTTTEELNNEAGTAAPVTEGTTQEPGETTQTPGETTATEEGDESAEELPTIAAAAGADPNLSTLVEAADAAGIVATLDAPGEFTIFAPTNDAFAALPEGTLEGLLADPDTLQGILFYHAAPGIVLAEDQATNPPDGTTKLST